MDRILLTCLFLAGGLMATPPPPSAQSDTGTSVKPWKRVQALRFFVGDQADHGSHVFKQGRFYLVHPSSGDLGYLLSTRDKSVHAVGKSSYAIDDRQPDLEIGDLSAYEDVGAYEKQNRGRWLVWKHGDRELAVKPKPPLIGKASLDQVLEEKPVYRQEADAYFPDPGVIEALQNATAGAEYVVGFGTWCPICAQWLPRFIKTMEAIGTDGQSLTFVSIDADLEEPAALLERFGIEDVPTIIVRRDGQELGRIESDALEEDPDDRIESRLVRILSGTSP